MTEREYNLLEFHDSSVLSINEVGDSIVIILDAYVQKWKEAENEWKGCGVSQKVKISVFRGVIISHKETSEDIIFRGSIQSNDVSFQDLPIPAHFPEETVVSFVFHDESKFSATGETVSLELFGDAKYIEDLPPEWQPEL